MQLRYHVPVFFPFAGVIFLLWFVGPYFMRAIPIYLLVCFVTFVGIVDDDVGLLDTPMAFNDGFLGLELHLGPWSLSRSCLGFCIVS